ncbi:Cobalt/magnesium transport protein CorA [BD1-7 clade bacterium]|uniref:Cobalt/magnesium transport protein CorA n=1 Tax=BD1-7 clade bacterium TaxID=2029982 RepID=A0A5S9QEU2_9GAMM|nr:Cobalt/magnesium transport protein CorA [BD1-7 clade bacterium]CAA0117042.1 Cobalt/magnesium transport protein CorA [BD1-7 clade bacterium]
MINCYWKSVNGFRSGEMDLVEEWEAHPDGVIWIDICCDSSALMVSLLERFRCHPMAIQDAVKPRHPPKFEAFKHDSFLLYQSVTHIETDLEISTQPLAFFMTDQMLITAHREPSIAIKSVAAHKKLSSLMATPASLMCHITIQSAGLYLDVLQNVELVLDDMEDAMNGVFDDSSEKALKTLYAYRARLRLIKRIFSYHESIFMNLLVHPELLPGSDHEFVHLIRDAYDKFERLLSLANMYYEQCGDLSQGYLSLMSHRLNETMQFLTVVTAIFAPLMLITGIYGMNFEFMPSLKYHFAYPATLSIMAAIAFLLYRIFKRKGWL